MKISESVWHVKSNLACDFYERNMCSKFSSITPSSRNTNYSDEIASQKTIGHWNFAWC